MNERYTRAPHQGTEGRSVSPNAALLIDFDNVTMGVRSNLGQELRNLLNSDVIRGKVSVQRAYADWRRYPQYVVPLSEASIDLIYAPAYGSSKKNATDIRLAIDALEVVFTRPEIGTFILLSGDSDFSSLVLKLKEYGKYVIGVGMQESSSELLVQNCDEYYSYDTLSGLVSADQVKTKKHDPWELVERAVKKMDSRNDVMRSDRLKQVMLELDSSFDEKEIGYSKFNRFLTEASSRGILELHRIGNGQYEVTPGDGAGAPASGGEDQKEKERPRGGNGGGGRSRRKSRRAGGGRSRPSPPEPVGGADSLKAAYDLLQDVVAELADPEAPVRDSEVKRRILERDSDFDEATLGFSKFSRFLRQAHDEGVVTLIKGEEGNYFLQTTDDGASTEPPAATGKPERPEPSRESRAEPAAGEIARPEPEPDQGSEAPGAAEPEEEEEQRAEEPEPEPPRRSVRGRRGRRGGGRGRRSPKAASGPDGEGEDDDSTVPGPVAGDGEEAEPAAGTSGPEPPAGATDADEGEPGTSKPGTLGRFRRGRRGGRRGRGGASGKSEGPDLSNAVTPSSGESPGADSSEGDTSGGESSGGEPSGGDGRRDRSADELVAHMAENYPGVGERTARALVEEFGDQTLDVIDREPGRIEELLPRHRAEAVLEARAEERDEAAG